MDLAGGIVIIGYGLREGAHASADITRTDAGFQFTLYANGLPALVPIGTGAAACSGKHTRPGSGALYGRTERRL